MRGEYSSILQSKIADSLATKPPDLTWRSVQLRNDRPAAIRLVGSNGTTVVPFTSESIAKAFTGADAIMNEAIFLGTYPGLTQAVLDYEIETIHHYIRSQ